MACEDYPCCGHAAGDCPRVDSKGNTYWTCVECGKRLPKNAPSSICPKCQKRRNRFYDEYGDYPEDYR